jgi:hypothetical protein
VTIEQVKALRAIGKAIVDTVKESDPSIGVPGGHIYAALMTGGCTLNQYEGIMAGLVKAQVLNRRGECYFVGPKASLLG